MNKIYTFLVLTSFVSCYYEVAARSSLRVVNGTDAEDGEFPFLVQLRNGTGDFHCGGSIIAPNWILSAAHCFVMDDIDHIVYGYNQLSSSPNTTIKVKKHFLHPKYAFNKNYVMEYDLALLQLSEPIPLGAKAKTVQLPADEDVPFHVETKFAGWGQTGLFEPYAFNLQKLTTQILTDDECRNIYNNASGIDFWLEKNNVCIENSLTGLCYGDSGTPLVVNGIQYGIASWVYKPCEMFPTAFVRISNPEYRKWIKEITNV